METVHCPVCKEKKFVMNLLDYEVPYFGKVLIVSGRCSNCNFKHNDVFIPEIKEGMEYKVKVESEEDLMIRVIRSSNCTVEIPELKAKIEPGPASQGYITNVEGILMRIEDVFRAHKLSLNEKKLEEVLKKIERMKEGKEGFTLVLKDPTGNSAIISEKAKKRKLGKDEIKKLKTSFLVFER